jgi:hypothetical protein
LPHRCLPSRTAATGAAFDIYSAQVLMAGGTCVYVPLRLKDGEAAADGSKQQGEWWGLCIPV